MTCKRCGSRMVERNGRYGQFLGCSSFPKCKGSQSIEDVDDEDDECEDYEIPNRFSSSGSYGAPSYRSPYGGIRGDMDEIQNGNLSEAMDAWVRLVVRTGGMG